MLTFFRKIRKSLVDSSSARKYVLYAVGEILLVMVGILLALQVNNWNENRRAKLIERNALSELLVEFERNQEQFNLVYNMHSEAKQGCLELQALTDRGFQQSDAELWTAGLDKFSNVWTFNPSSSIARSLISTANYEKVS